MNLNLYILPGLKINICMCVCHFHSYMTILIFMKATAHERFQSFEYGDVDDYKTKPHN
jgi:hypothetical protein